MRISFVSFLTTNPLRAGTREVDIAEIITIGRLISDWIIPPQIPYSDVDIASEYPDEDKRLIIIKLSSIVDIGIRMLEKVQGNATFKSFRMATLFVNLISLELQTNIFCLNHGH